MMNIFKTLPNSSFTKKKASIIKPIFLHPHFSPHKFKNVANKEMEKKFLDSTEANLTIINTTQGMIFF